ncbi:unnamed protein product, partial [Brassica oleracea]
SPDHVKTTLHPQEVSIAVKMRMMFSRLLTKSSTTTTKKNSSSNMLGRSCVMTRNGASFLLVKPKVVLKGGSVMTVHNLQPLTQPKPPL